MKQRLQKYMAAAGVASRRSSETLIQDGRVTVNGKIASLGQVVEEGDAVAVDGKLLSLESKVYLMLHKPAGYMTTARDVHAEHTVMELIKDVSVRVFPVGRLDKDTEGLLIFTNDGELAQGLLHPSQHVPKTYFVRVEGSLSEKDICALESGMELIDGMTAPAKVSDIQRDGVSTTFLLTIREGKKRQVRRMCGYLGRRVTYLKRVAVGELHLGDLPLGKTRFLSEDEVELLHQSMRRG